MRHLKRILTVLLLTAVLVSAPCLPARADNGLAYGAATVTAAVLNIRSGPGPEYSIVGTVTSGSIVVVLDHSNSAWYKINFEGTVGYVSTEYLKYVVTAANFTARGTITADSVRVRKGPGTSYDNVANCAYGESVDVIGVNNGWYKVVTNASITGYIRSDLMSVTGGRSSSGAIPSSGGTSSSDGTAPVEGGGTQYDAVIFGGAVRFRTGPGTNYDYIDTLSKGTKLTVIGIEGDWYKVIYDGKTGYVSTMYVTLDTSSAKPAESGSSGSSTTPAGTKGTVNASGVRFRSEASTSSLVIASLGRGTSVTVLTAEGGWYKCNYNGKTGYISQNYVTLESSATQGGNGGSSSSSTPSTGGGAVVTAGSLRLRSGPSTTNGTMATLSKGTKVTITSSSNGWLKVTVDGQSGWVSGEYISLTGSSNTLVGTIKGVGVRFRSQASTSSAILATMPEGARVCVYEKSGDWYSCSYNGKMGYVNGTFLTLDGSFGSTGTSTSPGSGSTSTSNNPGNATLGAQIAQYACQFDGYRYVYGEETPAKGFDCSGLVYYVYHTHYGYSMHRTASTQYRYDGTYVSRENLQPGDLVFFSSDGSGVTHVGIFVGSGKYGEWTFIHASTSKTGVKFDNLNSVYYKRVYFGAKRIV